MVASKDNLADDPGVGTVLVDSAAVGSKGKAQRIAIAELWCDPTLQPRDTDSVAQEVPIKVRSFLAQGYLADQPIMVEERDNGKGGKYCVLRGHCRTGAARYLLENQPDDYARIFPDGKIPAVVVKGLTDAQRTLAAIDQSDDLNRRPLNKYEQFVAVRALVKQGYVSQEGIAAKLGIYSLEKESGKQVPNRSWVQIRVNLARLPGFVQDEYEILEKKGEKGTAFRVPHISKLYKAYRENNMDERSENFLAVWKDCITPKETKSNGSKGKDRPFDAFTPAELDTLMADVGGNDELRGIIRALAGREPRGLIVANVAAIVETGNVLRGIRLAVGESVFADLVRDAHAALKAESENAETNGELVEA